MIHTLHRCTPQNRAAQVADAADCGADARKRNKKSRAVQPGMCVVPNNLFDYSIASISISEPSPVRRRIFLLVRSTTS